MCARVCVWACDWLKLNFPWRVGVSWKLRHDKLY